jgi:hypothetical protein
MLPQQVIIWALAVAVLAERAALGGLVTCLAPGHRQALLAVLLALV